MRAVCFALCASALVACTNDASNMLPPVEAGPRTDIDPPDAAVPRADTARPADLASPADGARPVRSDTAAPDLASPVTTKLDAQAALDLASTKAEAGRVIGVPTPNSWLYVVSDPFGMEAGEMALVEHSKQRSMTLVPIESRRYRASDPGRQTAVDYVWGRKGVVVGASGSSSSTDAAMAYKDLAVPIIVMYERAYNMNATIAWLTPISVTAAGSSKAQGRSEGTEVQIAATAGPLAGGLAGAVTVLPSSAPLMWGMPQSPEVIVVATLATQPTAAAIFAYPKGATLDDGSKAPAARAGFFFDGAEAAGMTADGYKLFDTLLEWAAAQ